MSALPAADYRGARVAITGASGYLASALRERLEPTGAQLLLVSRQPVPAGLGIERLQADVRTGECWREIVHAADVVFHLAGNTSAYAAAADPAGSLASTVLPIVHLIAAAGAARRVPRVVFASTATVYGFTPSLPVAEDAPTAPVTIYDLHKLQAEEHLRFASQAGVLDAVSLRLSNVYGPSRARSSADDRGILNKAAKRALGGGDLTVYGDGLYIRDYVYIDDVARAFLLAGRQPGIGGQSFNVGSGRGVTLRDAFQLVAERAARISARPVVVGEAAWPEDAGAIERRHFTANIERIATACGWRPQVELPEGVDLLCESLTREGRVVHG